jgi:hypothetical protein
MANLRAERLMEQAAEPRSSAQTLGVVRFADATTGRWIGAPLDVTAVGVTLVRALGGALLITRAPPSAPSYDGQPLPPPAAKLAAAESTPLTAPGSWSVAIDVRDPSGRYLPRRVRIPLPREPAGADAAGLLLRALPVALYPAPTAPLFSGWAVVRVSVKRGASASGVPYAWVRLRRASSQAESDPPLAVGIADARGEALIAVSAQLTTTDDPGDGAAPATEVDAVLEVYADPDASTPPDPDLIDHRRATLPSATRAVRLAAGRQISVRLTLDLP